MRRVPAWAWLAAVAVLLSALSYFHPPALSEKAGLHLLQVVLVGVALVRARREPHLNTRMRHFWTLLTVGLLTFLVADLTYSAVLFGLVPAWVDLPAQTLFVVGFLLFAAAVARVLHSRLRVDVAESLLDAVIVALSMAVLLWLFLPPASAGGTNAYVQLAYLAFPLLQAVVTAMCVTLLLTGAARLPAAWLLTGVSISTLVGNAVFVVLERSGQYVRGHPVDLAWLLAYVLFAVLLMHPSLGALVTPSQPYPPAARALRARLVVLGVALLGTPLTVAVTLATGPAHPGTAAAVGGALTLLFLFVAAFCRLLLLLAGRRHARAALRRSTRRQAAAARLGRLALGGASTAELDRQAIRDLRALLRIRHATILRDAPNDAGPAETVRVVVDEHGRQGLDADEQAFVRTVTGVLAAAARGRAVEAERARLLDAFLDAAERERGRVAADLHDGPIQQLTVLAMQVRVLRGRLRDAQGRQRDPAGVGDLPGLERDLGEQVRSLRRIMTALRPAALDQEGLAAALRAEAEVFRETTGVPCDVHVPSRPGLGRSRETVLYRVAQEALRNAARHARAHRVAVALQDDGDRTVLTVTDDGIGFDEEASRRAPEGQLGLAWMRERVELAGGAWSVRTAPGAGTAVRVAFPAPAHQPPAHQSPAHRPETAEPDGSGITTR